MVLVVRTKHILVKQRHLATRGRDHLSGNSAIFYIHLPATHVIILPWKFFSILSHGYNDFDNKVKETLHIKKQNLF